MSYLEKQYELLNKKSETLKDGDFPENGKLLGTFALLVNTIPLFHHRFSLWTQYVDSDLENLTKSITSRCIDQCVQDNKMSYGKNVSISTNCPQYCSVWEHESMRHAEVNQTVTK